MSGATGGNRASLRELFASTVVEAGTDVPDIEVTDVTATSSRVTAGGLFLACHGRRHHGLEFADEAVAAGAAVIAWEPESGVPAPALPAPVISLPVPNLSAEVGAIAHRFFGKPSAQIDVTGITGTNGKTTTAWLVAQAQQYLGATSGYMGTLGYGVGASLKPSALTTPGVIAVHRRLRELIGMGATTIAMEVSSHGLDQGRIDAVDMRIAAFTNLTRDHLDYHGSFEAYGAAKARLFAIDSLESAIINVGDPFGAELADTCPAGVKVIAIALQERLLPGIHASLTAAIVATSDTGLVLKFAGEFGEAEMHSPLWGRFNAENLLVAVGILLAQGYALADAVAALGRCAAPEGRTEIIRGAVGQPLVVIDFAHTPDALTQVIDVIRQHCFGAITVVFGCGGDRDKGKRGEMGSAASRLANRVIVTDDNPRYEDPQAIVDEIVAGMDDRSRVEVEHDRARAIRLAIEGAGTGDAVLVAGKGSERYQLVAGSARPFADAEIAASVMGVAS